MKLLDCSRFVFRSFLIILVATVLWLKSMKKFCNKITKPQWRVTVPTMNASVFKKSKSKDEYVYTIDEEETKFNRTSGTYDVQEAAKRYELTRSLPSPVYLSETSSESDNEKYDECIVSQKVIENSVESTSNQMYMDVEIVKKVENENEYDVPKISFKFFERKTSQEEENVYENSQEPGEQKQEEEVEETPDPNYEVVPVKPIPTPRHKNEVKITLVLTPEINIDEPEVPNVAGSLEYLEKEKAEKRIIKKENSLSRSLSVEEFVSSATIEFKQNNNNIKDLKKFGSVPNVKLRHHLGISEEDNEDVEEFYKVPRLLEPGNFSQSLNEIELEELLQNTTDSLDRSIEHISCSQVIPQSPHEDPTSTSQIPKPGKKSNYFKAKNKVTYALKNANVLKSSNTWYNLRSKFNNLMAEHAAQQRVGAFDDKEKVTINFEEMYKNSKNKCRKVFRNTSKVFKTKKRSESSLDKISERSSIRNDTAASKTCLTASDLEYKLNTSDNSGDSKVGSGNSSIVPPELNQSINSKYSDRSDDLKSAFRRNKNPEGQNGFEDLRRYVKQGSDFCKELSTILQDRADAETTYAKSLSKLSSKLSRACREGVGGLNEAWKAVAVELENRAEGHRIIGAAILEEIAKPLKTLTENQQRTRKQAENAVDKAAKALADWRIGEAKSKKHSHSCARENEKLQDAAIMDSSRIGKLTLSRSTSLIQLAHNQKAVSDKENAKLEGKKRKAEDAVKKADIEYYTLCVRAERARLEWESAVFRGVSTFQSLEEERLNNLKNALSTYLQFSNNLGPRLIEASDRLKSPIVQSEPTKDLTTFVNLRQSSQQISEQLLPDFYCEHITLAMNRERRKQALVKLLHLIRQDIDRERKSKNGLENLSKAIKQTPTFGNEDSQQNVTEKLYHMKSTLTYLEAARFKVQNALAELDSRPRQGHPLAQHITITRDKSGLQQSVLKVPQWLRNEWLECDGSPLSEKSTKSDKSDLHVNDIEDAEAEWSDRGAADGNSNQPDSDFDEFSSQCSSSGGIPYKSNPEESPVQPIAHCKALYPYTANLTDELTLKPGDILSVYRQQDDGWWLGECNGNVGIFPATYVEVFAE